MDLPPDLIRDTIEALDWLTTDARLRFDETKNNLEPGSQGCYSPELTKALATLNQLKLLRKFS